LIDAGIGRDGIGRADRLYWGDEHSRFAYNEVTISDLRAQMTSGQVTAQQVVEAFLDRIERLDRCDAKI
jgi:hypothetical protein